MNLHVVLYSTADKNMVYFVKHVLLFRFVMSKFQKQNLVKVPFHFVSQQKSRRSAAVFDVALAVRPF